MYHTCITAILLSSVYNPSRSDPNHLLVILKVYTDFIETLLLSSKSTILLPVFISEYTVFRQLYYSICLTLLNIVTIISD